MRRICWVLAVILLSGCTSKTAKKTLEEYNQVYERITTLEQIVNQADWNLMSGDGLTKIYDENQELYYDYNPMDLKPEQVTACEKLKKRVNKLRAEITAKIRRLIVNSKISAWEQNGLLLEKTETFPVYLQRGEKLRWNIRARSLLP